MKGDSLSDRPAWYGEDGCVISTCSDVEPVEPDFTERVKVVVRRYPSELKRLKKHRVFAKNHISDRCTRKILAFKA